MKKIIFFLFLDIFFILFKNLCIAQINSKIYEELKKDFSPISAYIIGKEDKTFIIDKGRVQGIKPKDIFMIYKTGKKIVHPITKKVLGYIKKPIGKLEIIRVDENFAIGKIISQSEKISVPALIKRFSELKILIIADDQTLGNKLFLILKDLLPESKIIFDPNLRFSEIKKDFLFSEKIDLLFVVEDEVIKVYNSYLNLIRAYGNLFYKDLKKIPKDQNNIKKLSSVKIYTPVLIKHFTGGIFQSEINDINNDGKPELIFFNSQGIFITDIKGNSITQYKPEKGKIINFSTGMNGLIALNIYDKDAERMKSEILKITSEGIKPQITNINLILQFVDYKGKGIKNTLLGQTFDSNSFFGKDVYILKIEKNQLNYVRKLDNLPKEFRIIGSIFADLDKDKNIEIIEYLKDGKIAVIKNSEIVWKIPYTIAEHFYNVSLIKGKPASPIIREIIMPLITPVLADFNRDGNLEIIFASIKFPLKQVVNDLESIPLESATSDLLLLGFKENYYFKNITQPQKGFITGIGVWKNQIFYTLVKGFYPGQEESYIYCMLY